MISVDSCFVCTTPFQVLTAINLVTLRRLEADVYVVPQFVGTQALADRMRELGIFRQVVLIDSAIAEPHKRVKSRLMMHFGIALNYLRVRRIVSFFHLPDVRYRTLYVSSKANIGRMMRLYYIKEHIPLRTVFFDDGESSYDNPARLSPSPADRFLRRLLFGREAVSLELDLLLYSPGLHERLYPSSPFRTAALPPISRDEASLRMFNRVFGYAPSDGIPERVIILDIIKGENLLPGEASKLDAAYRLFLDRFGPSQVVLKRHPRDKSPSDPALRIYAGSAVPFEVLLLNMDLRDKILVTASSTAVAAPKLLFGLEPAVVYLGNLVHTRQRQQAGDAYYRACQSLYSSPGRFLIPDSIQDLQNGLAALVAEATPPANKP